MCDWCSPNLTLTDADVVQGNAEIRAVYGDRSHILIVSTYQMCMLDLFNKADSLTFRYVHVESWSIYGCGLRRHLMHVVCALGCRRTHREISEAMNISGPECKRHLLSLTTSRNRILVNVSKVWSQHDVVPSSTQSTS